MEIEAPVRPAAQPGGYPFPGFRESPTLIAFCDEAGVVQIGAAVPAEHVELARGPVTELHDRLVQHARQREVNGQLRFIVPGMPEAPHAFIGLVSARCWIDWCAALEHGPVVWNLALKVTP